MLMTSINKVDYFKRSTTTTLAFNSLLYYTCINWAYVNVKCNDGYDCDPAEGKTQDMQKDLFIQQLEQIRQFVADCDRKVSVNKRRLEETQDQESLGPEALAVHQLNEQIGVKLAEAEDLGKKFIQNSGWLIFVSYGRNSCFGCF